MTKDMVENNNLYIYMDESGSITKTNINQNKYFVIAMLFTDKPIVVSRLFKKKISQLMRKNSKYEKQIKLNKEIKGADISETVKLNVSTGAKYDLEGYLNQQLTICNPICNHFNVRYTDSKNEKLVQLVDFLANSFYRNIEKNNRESKDTVRMWLDVLCNNDVFDFSEEHDIKLNLD